MREQGVNVMSPIEGDGKSIAIYRGDEFIILASSKLDAFIKAFEAIAYSIGVENGQLPGIYEENILMRGDTSLRHFKVLVLFWDGVMLLRLMVMWGCFAIQQLLGLVSFMKNVSAFSAETFKYWEGFVCAVAYISDEFCNVEFCLCFSVDLSLILFNAL